MKRTIIFYAWICCFLFLFLSLSIELYSSIIETEACSVVRSFDGDVDESARYSFSWGGAIQQNVFFNYSVIKIGYLLTGADYNYFTMENENARMYFYQFGIVGSLHCIYLFRRFFKNDSLYPIIRLHSGYNRTRLDSHADTTSWDKGNNLFFGTGAGICVKMYEKLYLKALYNFDTHLFLDGFLFVHSYIMALSYHFRI